jgi:glycosyltransferase involved in cell wall biosynthesis
LLVHRSSGRAGATGRSFKILIVASLRYPIAQPFAGGLEAHTWSLACGMRSRGHSVMVAGAAGSDPAVVGYEFGALPVGDAGDRPDTTEHPLVRRAEQSAYAGLMDQLRDGMLGSFDVIHNNSLHPLPVQRAASLPSPMVTTLHTPRLPWADRLLHGPTDGRPPGSDQDFVAVSRATAALWRPLINARVVRNGVDTTAWRAGPGGPGAVWFGRIVPEKAPHLAIDLARAAGFDLTIAGPLIDEGYFHAAVAPRLGPSVRYVGHLAQTELSELVGRSAVALVTPVWNEPFGLVAAEAMACGTPVVAFARGGLPEIVDPPAGRLIAPVPAAGFSRESLDAAVSAMTWAAGLDRRAIRRRAVGRLGRSAMIRGYEAVYADAVRRWNPS